MDKMYTRFIRFINVKVLADIRVPTRTLKKRKLYTV